MEKKEDVDVEGEEVSANDVMEEDGYEVENM